MYTYFSHPSEINKIILFFLRENYTFISNRYFYNNMIRNGFSRWFAAEQSEFPWQ